jgi:hypothetical protein
LVAGLVAIVGASVREAKLDPGVMPGPAQSRKARIAMSLAFVVILGVLWFGDRWWHSEANAYSQGVYKPLQMKADVNSADMLTLTLSDPGWFAATRERLKRGLFVRRTDDLIPDHDHLMHLYAIRQPDLDVVYHLHPDQVETGLFRLTVPSMPEGTYKLYADIVHANGFPETLVSSMKIRALNGRALTGDDAAGVAVPWERADASITSFHFPDGYRMEWLRGNATLRAKQPMLFRFRLIDPAGRNPNDMGLYMGMLGHAAFVKTDGTVFAHIHPTGSVSMAAFMLAQGQAGKSTTHTMDMPGMDMSNMDMSSMDHSSMQPGAPPPSEVSFPYGFPTPGRYRIFVQMKHGATVETGIFDATVAQVGSQTIRNRQEDFGRRDGRN